MHPDAGDVAVQQPGSVETNSFSIECPDHIPTRPLHGGGIETAPAVQNGNFKQAPKADLVPKLHKGQNLPLMVFVGLDRVFTTLPFTPRRPQLCWI